MADSSCAERHNHKNEYDEYRDRGDDSVHQGHSDAVEISRVIAVYALGDVGHEKWPVPEEHKRT